MKKIFQFLALAFVLTASPLLYGSLDVQDVVEMDAACKAFVDAVGDRPVAHLEVEIQECVVKLHELYPDHRWSALFLGVLQDIQNDGNVIVHQQMVDVVKECLDFCAQELEKNLPYAHEIGTIQSYLLDYQQFLSSAKSRLDVNSALLFKARSCRVRPCSNALKCFELKSLLVDGNDVLPFLPTGPIVIPEPSEVNNYFYASKLSEQGQPLQTFPFDPLQFDNVHANDGSWQLINNTDFVAQVSGIFLVTIIIPYTVTKAAGSSSRVFMSPSLDNVAPLGSLQQLMVGIDNVTGVEDVLVSTNFIMSAMEGAIFTIINWQAQVGGGTSFAYATPAGFSGQSNGTITIVRLR